VVDVVKTLESNVEAPAGRPIPSGVHGLDAVFRPRSVAVIGASRRPDSFGGATFRHALAAGFRGELYPVNPNVDFVGSRRAQLCRESGASKFISCG